MRKPKAVTSPPTNRNMRFDRKNGLIGLIVLVLLIGGGLWYWAANRSEPEPKSNVPQYTGQKLVDEVNKRYGQHNYAGVIALLKGQKTINETETQLLLAAAYTNNRQYQKALDIYDNLEQQNKLNEVYSATAADAAERAQQYKKAVDYYKKAKQRADPDATDQIAVYDYKITELEKKQ